MVWLVTNTHLVQIFLLVEGPCLTRGRSESKMGVTPKADLSLQSRTCQVASEERSVGELDCNRSGIGKTELYNLVKYHCDLLPSRIVGRLSMCLLNLLQMFVFKNTCLLQHILLLQVQIMEYQFNILVCRCADNSGKVNGRHRRGSVEIWMCEKFKKWLCVHRAESLQQCEFDSKSREPDPLLTCAAAAQDVSLTVEGTDGTGANVKISAAHADDMKKLSTMKPFLWKIQDNTGYQNVKGMVLLAEKFKAVENTEDTQNDIVQCSVRYDGAVNVDKGHQKLQLQSLRCSKLLYSRDPHGLKNTGAFEQDVFLTMSDEEEIETQGKQLATCYKAAFQTMEDKAQITKKFTFFRSLFKFIEKGVSKMAKKDSQGSDESHKLSDKPRTGNCDQPKSSVSQPDICLGSSTSTQGQDVIGEPLIPEDANPQQKTGNSSGNEQMQDNEELLTDLMSEVNGMNGVYQTFASTGKDAQGSEVGSVQGSEVGSVQGSEVGSVQGSEVGSVQGSEVEDSQWGELYNVQGNEVVDAHGSELEASQESEVDESHGSEVEAGNGSEVEDSQGSEVEAGNGSEVEDSQGSEVEAGNRSEVEAGNGSEVEAGNGSEVEDSHWSEVEAGQESEVDKSHGSEVEAGNGSEVEDSQGSELEAGQESEVDKSHGSEVEAGNGSEVEDSQGSEVEDSQGSEVEDSQGSEVEDSQGSEVEDSQGSEVDKSHGSEVEAGNRSEVEAGQGSEVDESHGSEVEAGNGSEVEDNQGSEVEDSHWSEVEAGHGCDVKGGAAPVPKSTNADSVVRVSLKDCKMKCCTVPNDGGHSAEQVIRFMSHGTPYVMADVSDDKLETQQQHSLLQIDPLKATLNTHSTENGAVKIGNDLMCQSVQENPTTEGNQFAQTEVVCMQMTPMPQELRKAMVTGQGVNREWLTLSLYSNASVTTCISVVGQGEDDDKDSDDDSKERKRKAMDRLRRENEEKRLKQKAANLNKGFNNDNHSPRTYSAHSDRSDTRDPSYKQQPVKKGQVVMSNVNQIFREGSFVPLPSQEAMARNIGKGGNGVVGFIYHGRKEFAVKETCLRQEELETWSSVTHPNVIEICAVIEGDWDAVYPGTKICYQMMPRVTGDIKSMLEEKEMPTLCHYFYDFKEDSERAGLVLGNAKYILLSVLNGLKHLHSLGIMHRDIKLQNILVDRYCQCRDIFQCPHYGDTGYGVFISDFDSALRVDRGREKLERSKLHGQSIKYSVHGTPGYRPPETSFPMSSNEVLSEWISLKTDIWSFGTMLVKFFVGSRGPHSQREMATLLLVDCLQSPTAANRPRGVRISPLQALAVDQKEIKELQKVALLEKYFPLATELHRLVQSCLTVNVEERPSAEQVMEKAFFRSISKVPKSQPASSTPAAVKKEKSVDGHLPKGQQVSSAKSRQSLATVNVSHSGSQQLKRSTS